MKKRVQIVALLFILLLLFSAWKIFGPTVKRPDDKFIYIKTGSVYQDVISMLEERHLIAGKTWFNLVAKTVGYKIIKPGKYAVNGRMSIFSLVRMLKNGRQTPVDLVIIKFRTKEDFARRIGKEFETDSIQMLGFLNNNDSLKRYGLDTNTWACAIIPDTYIYFWNSTPGAIFSKLHGFSEKFWTPQRLDAVKAHHLSTDEAYILASIIEEETNSKADKGKIASVYLNRVSKNLPLQADPTIKFAMRDFGLKRIYDKYLTVPSPYNTYLNKGLPPGPICTPSVETLDEVINAPETNYIYFVANSDLNGGSVFTSSYEEHMKNARLYQQALNRQDSIRKARQTTQQ